MIFTIVIFILTLLLLVVIHEFGHFIMAKKFNIKVLEFGFGIPPRAWGKKIGETIYSFNWLPLGGFVRLLGEDEVDKNLLEDKRSFAYQNIWKRIAVVVAGVVMNFFLAFVLFYIVLFSNGFKAQMEYKGNYDFIGATQIVEPFVLIRQVEIGSPADEAGIKSEDRVLAINGTLLETSKDFTDMVKSHAGDKITLTVSNVSMENKKEVSLVPRKDPPPGQGAIGVAISAVDVANISYDTPIQKLFSAPIHSWNMIAYSGVMLGELIDKSFQEKNFQPLSTTVAGPVGITSIANSILTQEQNPLVPYLAFMAMISLNLAVFNLLPFPALDGGRLFFLYIEALTKKKVHPNIERWIHTIGMAILLILSVLITASDIKKLL